jgi:hypothetical protein
MRVTLLSYLNNAAAYHSLACTLLLHLTMLLHSAVMQVNHCSI